MQSLAVGRNGTLVEEKHSVCGLEVVRKKGNTALHEDSECENVAQ